MLKIYFMLKAQYLKTAMEYTLNFWMMVIAGILMRTLMMGVAYVLFRNMPTIAGFTESEVYLIMALMFVSEGMCNLLFDGIWYIPQLVYSGQFDLMLSRPVSPLYQVLSHEVGLQGVGVVAIGLVSLGLSLAGRGWLTLPITLACVGFIATGTTLRMSSYLIGACFVFFKDMGGNFNAPYTFYSIGEYAKYPVSVYPMWMRGLLFTLIPYGFIGYVPVLILRGENTALWVSLMITASVLYFFLARGIFYRSIRRYESMGM